MVLKFRSACGGLTALPLLATMIGAATPASAQSPSAIAPSVGEKDPAYETPGLNAGAIKLFPSLLAGVTYDSNIYAQETGEKDDAVFTLTPEMIARYESDALTLTGRANASIRRFASVTRENSVGAVAETKAVWEPSLANRFILEGGWNRLVESRGDPEAREQTTTGPRRTDLLFGTLEYRRESGRMMFNAKGSVYHYNVLSRAEAERDFTSYIGQAGLGYRLGGSVYGTLTGFISRRDARLAVDNGGINRDATTYGGRVGVQIDPGGLIEGSAGVGVFRLDPDASVLPGRTGVSVEASLTYRPALRTAIIAEAFRGDVATFRIGALSRTDTRLGLTLQQEIRHNLFGRLGGSWREARYYGNGLHERTATVEGETELLLTRAMAVSANASYGKRTSNDPTKPFERFRGGFQLRVRL